MTFSGEARRDEAPSAFTPVQMRASGDDREGEGETETQMSGIVCAIRGGPRSQLTIAQAITLAQKTGLPLYFLYVVNLDFLSHTSHSRIHTISEEMHHMGEFIVLAAQSAAAERGIAAQGVVRHGNVADEIIGLCQDLNADYVVIGRPGERGEESIFGQNLLKRFSEHIEQETKAQIVLAEEVSV